MRVTSLIIGTSLKNTRFQEILTRRERRCEYFSDGCLSARMY